MIRRRRWRRQLRCRHVRCHHERRRRQHRRSRCTGRRIFITGGMGRFGSRGSGIGSDRCFLTGGQAGFAAAASFVDAPATAAADPRRPTGGRGSEILAVQRLEVGPLRTTRRFDAGRWRDDSRGAFGRRRSRLGRLPLLLFFELAVVPALANAAAVAAAVAVADALPAEFALATGGAARAAGSADVTRSAPAARATRRAAGRLSAAVIAR
mmetsp:Transcript_21215/g.40046  ORF Transcript_21215/g.40046 Transcript_21215/m.40046 type:complete len:210 (-) Transcript_21215:18-647(-)